MKVFVSHQRKDKSRAKAIADYLSDCGIDVYFDKFDRDLLTAVLNGDADGVVAAITYGVAASTHMLVVVSQSTMKSAWVPFEIGYGYDRLSVHVLTLEGLQRDSLPDYLKVVPIIGDIEDIDEFARAHWSSFRMLSEGLKKTASFDRHRLKGVMAPYNP